MVARAGSLPNEAPAPGLGRAFPRSVIVALTADDVAKLAALARVHLDADELEHLAPQLDDILSSMGDIATVAGPDVPPTTHALPLTNVFRADVVTGSLTPEEVLANAPSTDEGMFRVPRILGESA